jgi:uncharacterized FlaG/YvyC family protein
MVNAVADGGGSSVMSSANTPAITTAVASGVMVDAGPSKPTLPLAHDSSGFVAVVPKATAAVNLEQVNQNVQDAIGRLNDMLEQNGRGLSFSMDKSINGPVITVTSVSGEVIRQIPNQAVLDVAHNIDAIKGLLYNSIA